MTDQHLPRYHAASWDEPVVLSMGRPDRRAMHAPEIEPDVHAAVGDAAARIPAHARRQTPPALPGMTEFEVQRHYLHLAQMTLGMMGINLFGTCTMKYNPRLGEDLTFEPRVSQVHPGQPVETVQGMLEVIYGMDHLLRELSGMDQFVFQAGGGAHAAYTQACVTRAYFADRGELDRRRDVITTIQTHPCNAATAHAAGFNVITLPLDEGGYPSFEALEAALSDNTAALMINNPDDMGIYNPNMRRWVDAVHETGALAFWDSANFNGIMGRIRARELGFDACMYMLHKTFGAPKGGGGPAVGAYGCTEELKPYLPRPLVIEDGDGGFDLEFDMSRSIGKVREYWGNVPQIIKAYSWSRAMGAEGIKEAASLSVLANNYMEQRLLKVRGVSRSNDSVTLPRLEMTRFSLEQVQRDTGITVFDIQHRMVDFGVDAFWLSHEPWLVPEPFTPEAGELWSKEDLDIWIDVLEHVIEEAYSDPELVRTAPHNQAIDKVDVSRADDPEYWATTWRAHLRKHGPVAAAAGA